MKRCFCLHLVRLLNLINALLSIFMAPNDVCYSFPLGELLGAIKEQSMSDHLAVAVDRLESPGTLPQGGQRAGESEFASRDDQCGDHAGESSGVGPEERDLEKNSVAGEDEPLIQAVECRICQEEDSIKNLEVPCACNGSLKYVHRKCVQRWCDEKGDITCEICHHPFQPGYTAPAALPEHPDDTTIDISGVWTVARGPLDLNDPRILAMAAAERQLLEAEYDDYADNTANGAAFCRSAALILIALLLLRHALTITNSDEDKDDVSTFFSLFLLRAAGFLLPCYIMAWAISILQRRRQRQEAAALTASEVAYVIQAGQHRGLQVHVAPGTPQVVTNHQETQQS